MNILQLIVSLSAYGGWIFLGGEVTNILFPGYSMCPENMNHLWFMLIWVFTPFVTFTLVHLRRDGNTDEVP